MSRPPHRPAAPFPPARQILAMALAASAAACELHPRAETPPPTVQTTTAVTRTTARTVAEQVDRTPGGRPNGAGDPRRDPAPAPARTAFDPVGEYDLTFTAGDATWTGTMVVRRAPGGFTGRIRADGRPDVAIATLTASGDEVVVTGDVQPGVLLLRFRLTSDSLRGDWSLHETGGGLTGARRAPRSG